MQQQPPYGNFVEARLLEGQEYPPGRQPTAPRQPQSRFRQFICDAPQYMAPILLAAVVFYTAFLNRKANESGCEELEKFTRPGMWGCFAGDVLYLAIKILSLRANSQELRETYTLLKGDIVRDGELPLALRALPHLSNISIVATAVATAILFVTANPVEACVGFITMGFVTLGLSHYQRALWRHEVTHAQSVFANRQQPGQQLGQQSGFA